MSWKGNSTSPQQSGVGINPAPNIKQDTSNGSDVRRPVVQSGDTGRVFDTSQPPIPLVGPYKKEFAVRRDLDKTENFSVDLITIDTTIINHMNQRLDISVMDNGTLVKVPILYASPERWKAVKADGYLRDNQGKILLPAILIKRTGVSNNKDLMTFNRYLSYQVVTKFDQKNKYDKFNILNVGNPFKSKPTKQVFNVTLPDHVMITYECILWTDYVDQNNKILEKINFATHDYWGVDGFRFRTRIDDYTNTVEVGAGEDRNVKTTFTLTVYAYLLPKTIDGVKSTTQKTFTTRKIVVSDSAVNAADMAQLEYNAQNQNPYAYLKNLGVKYNTDPNVKLKTEDPKPIIEKSMFRPAPTTTSDFGMDGWLAYDRDYIYVYKSPNGWLRKPIPQFDFDAVAGAYVSGYDCNGAPIYSNGVRPINTAFRIFQRFPDKFYHQVPYQSADYGEEGWISYDGSYFYIYAYGEWRRIPINLFTETF
jgi:hypothetical protein